MLYNVPSQLQTRMLSNGNSIRITWKQPQNISGFMIVRSKEKIDTPTKFFTAQIVKKIRYRKYQDFRTIIDKNIPKGSYYYAVLNFASIRKKEMQFIPDFNITTQPLEILQDKNQYSKYSRNESPGITITDLKVQRIKHFIKISWKPIKYRGKINYHIYRSEEPLSKISAFQNAKKVITLYQGETSYLDLPDNLPQTVYYGVTVELDKQEYKPLIPNISFIMYKTQNKFYNYVKNKLDVQAAKTNKKYALQKEKGKTVNNLQKQSLDRYTTTTLSEDYSDLMDSRLYLPSDSNYDNIDEEEMTGYNSVDQPYYEEYEEQILLNIIQLTYYKKKYKTAIHELSNYIKTGVSEKRNSKALFYIALSYYHRGMFDKALKLLLKKELQNYYQKDRVAFYIDRCIENKERVYD